MLFLLSLLRHYATRSADSFIAHNMDSSPFSQLVRKLRQTVGRDMNVREVKALLYNYKATRSDYARYITWTHERYTRNLIDQGNGRYNMIIMCWGSGHKAPIHSHPGANCFVRMLEGEMEEQLYSKPVAPEGRVTLQRSRELKAGDVIHIRDDISIHSMANRSAEGAVTLHIYTPPYNTCEIFSEGSSETISAPIMYTTKGGEYQPQPEGITL